MAKRSVQSKREQARAAFAKQLAETRDPRQAARAVGVSERTGRRWAKEAPAPIRGDTLRAVEVDRFVGRSTDLEAIRSHFDRGARLVSVVGPPGIGKTRLAVRVLSEPGGWQETFFCDAREARSALDLCSVLAEGLELHANQEHAVEAMVDGIGHALCARGPILVVLDNFEQLVEIAVNPLHRWLRLAPEARFLITSRRILNLEGEHIHELAPLSLPTTNEDVDADATQLFVERATAVAPHFDPALHRQAIADLVTSLEGIPLALELAAGQMRRTTPDALLATLGARPSLRLQSSRRDVDPRHGSLRTAIDSSWDLLEPWERDTLVQLTVFRGGFTSNAAEATVDLGAFPNAPSVADVLSGLRDSSLLRVEKLSERLANVGIRWGTYRAVHDYASDLSGHDDTRTHARSRHVDYFLRRGEELVTDLVSVRSSAAHATLALEIQNLRQAFTSLTSDSNVHSTPRVSQLALVLHKTLKARLPSLAAEVLTVALSGKTKVLGETDLPAQLHLARAELNRSVGHYAKAEEDLQQAQIFGPSDPGLQAAIECERARLQHKVGNFREARGILEQTLETISNDANTHLRGRLELALAFVLSDGLREVTAFTHYDAAAGYFRVVHAEHDRCHAELMSEYFRIVYGLQRNPSRMRQLVAEAYHLNDRWLEATGLNAVGMALQEQGSLTEALEHYQDAKRIAARAGLRYAEAATDMRIANLHDIRGSTATALQSISDARATWGDLGAVRCEGLAMVHLAGMLARRGDTAEAVRTLDEAKQKLSATGDALAIAIGELQTGAIELSLAQMRENARARDEANHLRSVAAQRVRTNDVSGTSKTGLPQTQHCFEIRCVLGRLIDTFSVQNFVLRELRVGSEGSTFQLDDGPLVELPPGQSIRRVLITLTTARIASPGHPIGLDEVLRQGWPGEDRNERSRALL